MSSIINQPITKQTRGFNSSNYTISRISSLNEITESEYAPLSAGRTFYVSRPWLLAIETLRGKDTGYVVARSNDGSLIGLLPLYWGKPSERGYYEPFNRFLNRSGGNFIREDWSPTYIIGSRAAYSCEFLLANNLEEEEKNIVLRNMFDVAKEHSEECQSASFAALYMNNTGRTQLTNSLKSKPEFFITGANAILDIKWDSYDEYITSEKTTVRREIRVFSSKGYKICSYMLADTIDILSELFAQHESKYGHKTSSESEARELKTLADTANKYSHVLVLELNGRSCGAILLFLWDDTVYARNVGFVGKGNAFEYFNLTYYEIIRFAIENGYKHIDYGMATYRAKLSRGARIEPLWGFLQSDKVESPLTNSTFAQWNQCREEAIKLRDVNLIERSQIP